MSQKDLFQRGSINLAVKLTGQLLNLAVIPIYINALTPERYGALNVGFVLLNFFVLFAVLGMNESITRYFPEAREEDKGYIIRTSLFFTLLWALLLFTLQIFFIKPLTLIFLDDTVFIPLMRLMLIIAVLESLNLPVTMLYHVEKRNGLYALALTGKNSIKLLLTWLFLGLWQWGVTGAAAALLAGSLFYILPVHKILVRHIKGGLSLFWLKKLLTYGAPFMLTAFAMTALFQIDQLLIKFLLHLKDVAVYGMAYKLGSAVQYINAAFALAWFPYLFSMQQDEARKVIPKTLYNYLKMVLPAANGLTVAARYYLPYILPETYTTAADIIPWVIWGYVAYSLSDFLGAGLLIQLKSHFFSIAALAALVINIALNLIWIPRFGIIGAAWSTFISMSALTVISYIWAQSVFPVSYRKHNFKWLRLFLLYLLPLALSFIGWPFPLWISGILLSVWIIGIAHKTGAFGDLLSIIKR